ncbi:hypothetical protein [Sinorhizobium medicae]
MKAIVFSVGLPPSAGGAIVALFFVLSSMPVTPIRSPGSRLSHRSCSTAGSVARLIYELRLLAIFPGVWISLQNL